MTMPVFYRDAMTAAGNDSYSPSAGKPLKVVMDWLEAGLINTADIKTFEPVRRSTIKLAHDANMVDAILDLDEDNGFGNRLPSVAQSLPFTTGSMLAAAEHVVLHGGVACSPTSGFHHAGHDYCGGYCTFNGLAITALKLKQDGIVNRVGILDCDAHYGDGTQHIIDKLGLDWIDHETLGRFHWDKGEDSRSIVRYYDTIHRFFERAKSFDLILYQAGADPHTNDPLGGMMTTAQMKRRDRMVFDAALAMGIPLAWNLAGGYQRDHRGTIKPVLDLHRNTLIAYKEAINERMDKAASEGRQGAVPL